MVSPLGSAAIPPVPNPTHPINETARLAEATDRTTVPRRPSPAQAAPYATISPNATSAPERRGLNPVVKIVLESLLVFGLCLVLYFIIRAL